MYQPRFYRQHQQSKDLVSFEVIVKETDLYISAKTNLTEQAKQSIQKYRLPLEEYIKNHKEFLTSLEPLPREKSMPGIAEIMTIASASAGVGPMAAVAGAMAELVGRDLLLYSDEIIIENGGDIFISAKKQRIISIYPGDQSPFKNKLAITIQPEQTPLGVCTSSGTVGHSLSFGRADSVTILSADTALADAAATAVGNIIKTEADLAPGIEFAKKIPGICGALLVIGTKMSVWGEIKLVV